MIDIRKYCLKNNNTFKISVIADRYISFDDPFEFVDFAKENRNIFKRKFLLTGEGSNILYTRDFDGTVIQPKNRTISMVSQNNDYLFVKAGAGYNWDEFVDETMKLEAYGLENLSLIPGTVGASVVQNIGAYGAEAGDFVYSVEYLCLNDFTVKIISGDKCKFAYRDSIFKKELKDKAIVLNVTYKLNKIAIVNAEYADIQSFFESGEELTAQKIRNAVVEIRNKKLPDPEIIGNAGSFFKNPIIDDKLFKQVLAKHPRLRFYDLKNGSYKLAAGWLIDQCKLKGFEFNGAAVHENQALVLINKSGETTGSAVLELSNIIQEKVKTVYGVVLEPEVIIL